MSIFGCWHKWGKYTPPANAVMAEGNSDVGYFKVCQLRVCETCGLAEYNELPKMRRLDGLENQR